jgi:hypothetical protein
MGIRFKTTRSVLGFTLLMILVTCSLFLPWLRAEEMKDMKKGEHTKVELPQSRMTERSEGAGISEEISIEKRIPPQKERRESLYDEIIGFFKIVALVLIVGGISGGIGYFLYSYNKRIRKIERVLENTQEGSSRGTTKKEDLNRYSPQPGRATGEVNFQQEIPALQKRMDRFEKQSDALSSEIIRVSRDLRDVENRSRAVEEIIPLFANFFKSFQEIGGKIGELQKKGIAYSQEQKDSERGEPRGEEVGKKKEISEKDLIKWWQESGNQLLAKCRKTIEEEFKDAVLEVIGTTEHDKEDWRMIGIKNIRQKFFYVLPRKYSIWSPIFQKWFELEETGHLDPRIGSVYIPLPKASKDDPEGWGLVDKKGKVSIREVS